MIEAFLLGDLRTVPNTERAIEQIGTDRPEINDVVRRAEPVDGVKAP